jgi:hypothetical protein
MLRRLAQNSKNIVSGAKFDLVVPSIMILLSLGLLGATLWRILDDVRTENQAGTSILLDVKSAWVIGSSPIFFGDPKAPLTIIEFGDYQCPYCRTASIQLMEAVKRHTGQIRFEFRNLPIPAIHPLAYKAAVTAALGAECGCYWEIHSELFANSITESGLVYLQKSMHPNKLQWLRARERVRSDGGVANNLGFVSTPVLIECYPDGRVTRIDSVSDAMSALTSSSRSKCRARSA